MALIPLPDDEAIQWIKRYAERWGLRLMNAEPAIENDPLPHRDSATRSTSRIAWQLVGAS